MESSNSSTNKAMPLNDITSQVVKPVDSNITEKTVTKRNGTS